MKPTQVIHLRNRYEFKRIIFQNFNLVKDLDIGQKFFLLGIFFLPSAVQLSFVFIGFNIFSFINNKENLLKINGTLFFSYPL